MIEPYYSEDGITIYNADCREVLSQLERMDLVLTDPPYGLELGAANNQDSDSTHLHKAAYESYSDTYEDFVAGIVPRLNAAIDAVGRAIVFTGPHIHEQRKPIAIGGIYHPSATGRTPWGSKNFLPILFYGLPPTAAGTHRPTVFRSTVGSEKNGHPCPKPIQWIRWLLSEYTLPTDIVLDPFMGSGTTLRAAKDMGLKATGIEIEKKYCDIAIERLRQRTLLPAMA